MSDTTFISIYTPRSWYWVDDEGRVFASARMLTMSKTAAAKDPDYRAWLKAGNGPSKWPRDEQGRQTMEELERTLSPHGVYASLHSYAAMRRWEVENGGIVVAAMPIPTDERTRSVLTAAYVKAKADPAYKIGQWKVGAGLYMTLTGAQIIMMADAVEAHVGASYARNAEVDAGIAAGTIIDKAGVDAAFAPLSPRP